MADKVISLLEKGQQRAAAGALDRRRHPQRGDARRPAREAARLRNSSSLPESPWFEAWGSALLTRDDPLYSSPQISAQPISSHLPPLSLYGDRVQVIAAPPLQAPPDGAMVLGVDAGSTTTKAVLLDPATAGVVASHYTRTKGDPVAATRECLQRAGRSGRQPAVSG